MYIYSKDVKNKITMKKRKKQKEIHEKINEEMCLGDAIQCDYKDAGLVDIYYGLLSLILMWC